MTATEQPAAATPPPRRVRDASAMRRALRAISTVLIVAGVLLIADAAITLAWQEPVSALLARIQQDKLSGELKRIEQTPPTRVQRRVLAALPSHRRRIDFLAREARRTAQDGDPIGRIDIPKIGADFVVVQGTDGASLRKGPGHYPDTTFPGLDGTVAIAGHRTTYLAPFRNVDDLRPGDRIVLTMPYGRFTYAVQRTQIVPPTALWVTRDVGYDRLVLSACHPLYSAAERIIVFARLVRTQARGAALRG
jgi:sortase A